MIFVTKATLHNSSNVESKYLIHSVKVFQHYIIFDTLCRSVPTLYSHHLCHIGTIGVLYTVLFWALCCQVGRSKTGYLSQSGIKLWSTSIYSWISLSHTHTIIHTHSHILSHTHTHILSHTHTHFFLFMSCTQE